MNSWFECKVKYDKEIEGGMQKTVSEPYIGGTNAKSISSPSTRKAVLRNVPLLI